MRCGPRGRPIPYSKETRCSPGSARSADEKCRPPIRNALRVLKTVRAPISLLEWPRRPRKHHRRAINTLRNSIPPRSTRPLRNRPNSFSRLSSRRHSIKLLHNGCPSRLNTSRRLWRRHLHSRPTPPRLRHRQRLLLSRRPSSIRSPTTSWAISQRRSPCPRG